VTLNVAPPTVPGPCVAEDRSRLYVIDQFTKDERQCNLSPSTLKKYRSFTALLKGFCTDKGIVYILIRHRPRSRFS